MKFLSSECKSSLHTLPPLQVNRFQKICDQIDSLTSGFSPSPSTQFATLDLENLKDLVLKKRSRLKGIDELLDLKRPEVGKVKSGGGSGISNVAKTSVFSKSDGVKKVYDSTLLRSEIKSGLALLDSLDIIIQKKETMLEYFSDVRHVVHDPLESMNSILTTLPNLSEIENQFRSETEVLNRAITAYNTARSVEILSKMATLKFEIDQIEHVVNEMLAPIKFVVLNAGISKVQSISGSKKGWLPTLVNILQLNTVELLSNGSNESIRSSFVASVLELQRHLSGALDIKSYSFNSALGEDVKESIQTFDFELFAAFLDDGAERVSLYNSVTKSEEFVKCYKNLVNARNIVQRYRLQYEKLYGSYVTAVRVHNEAKGHLNELQIQLGEFAWTDLGQPVDVVFPQVP
eukprot:CAMPEP_0170086360 /NCGR_PEP_ID=MMETSP0019_2-20121128/21054_1 /TAXON_ID=98059 /ORGANISM="Dinobryon sp., Strain UTEXLB2267" /LENGTH=403 /DNA_ID=CAMNT_0010303365 /DNA_START=22 /DNA_END=1233 /DNA_ORIENTATION=+